MKSEEIIRAWKDPNYLANLSDRKRKQVPPNPAGIIELSDEQLSEAAGATWFCWIFIVTEWYCHMIISNTDWCQYTDSYDTCRCA